MYHDVWTWTPHKHRAFLTTVLCQLLYYAGPSGISTRVLCSTVQYQHVGGGCHDAPVEIPCCTEGSTVLSQQTCQAVRAPGQASGFHPSIQQHELKVGPAEEPSCKRVKCSFSAGKSPDSANRRTRDHHRQSIKKNTRMFQGQCTVILYGSHSPLPFRIPTYISFWNPAFPFSPPLLFNCIIQYFIYFFSSFRFVLISCVFFHVQ